MPPSRRLAPLRWAAAGFWLACLAGTAVAQDPASVVSGVGNSGVAAPQPAPAWDDDLEAACDRAVQQGKDVLVLFAGTGWSAPCAAMQREVFAQPRFLVAVSSQFELVRFETPEDPEALGVDDVASHAARVARFDVQSFPTILLVDPQGTPYARSRRYRAEGPDAFLARLEGMQGRKRMRDEAFKEVDQLGARLADAVREGSAMATRAVSVRRVELLNGALQRLHAEVPMRDYVSRIEELLESMATTGRRETKDTKFWRRVLEQIETQGAVQALEQRAAVLLRKEAYQALDAAMRDLAPDVPAAVRQRALFFRMIGVARHREDYAEALRLAEQAIALDPVSEFVDVLDSYAAQLRTVAHRSVAPRGKE